MRGSIEDFYYDDGDKIFALALHGLTRLPIRILVDTDTISDDQSGEERIIHTYLYDPRTKKSIDSEGISPETHMVEKLRKRLRADLKVKPTLYSKVRDLMDTEDSELHSDIDSQIEEAVEFIRKNIDKYIEEAAARLESILCMK